MMEKTYSTKLCTKLNEIKNLKCNELYMMNTSDTIPVSNSK